MGKKRSHFATAGALIASISMIAFSGDKPNSQALVEVNHQEMPLMHSSDFDIGFDWEMKNDSSLFADPESNS